MSLPNTMHAIALRQPGGPEELVLDTQAAVPQPGPGEIIIRVRAAGINRPDVLQRLGAYPPPPGADPRLGLEVAGEVAALGEGARGFAVGDRVCALVNGGGYAQYAHAPAGQVLPVPAGLSMAQAAALPETFFTVHENLFRHGRLAAGETLLVHGGTSGIGTAAIMLGRAFGARVLATAGSADKCAACVALGADAAIDYKTEDFVTRVAELTGGRGVDVVLDMVAGAYVSRNISCLAPLGRLVVIAVQGGIFDPSFNILPVMQKRLVITGSTLRPRSHEEKAVIAAALRARVWPLLEAGQCLPVIDSTYPLAEAAAAHARMETGAHIGKIVLMVD